MAYFDSEKNKAMWEKRLSMLEQERNRRKLEGYKPQEARKQAAQGAATEMKPGVRIITYEQLIAKEEARHNAKVKAARAARQASMAPAPQAQAGKSL